MGLGHGALVTSWYITYAIIVLIQAILITLITANNIFKQSDKGIVFLLFFLFGLSTMSLCMLASIVVVAVVPADISAVATAHHLPRLPCPHFQLTVFFSKSKTAVIIGLVILFCSVFPIISVGSNKTSESAKVLLPASSA
jgi:hypothetical protein